MRFRAVGEHRVLRDPYAWSIAAVPWLLFFISAEWPYTADGWVDPWVYLGGFLDLPGQLGTYKNTYYMTRLPWLLSGYATYLVLPPLAANAVLKIATHTVVSVGTYSLARPVAGRSAAAATSIALSTWYWFLYAVRTDYVDGFMISILVLTLLALDRAARAPRGRLLLGIAGALFMVMLATNQVILLFAPALAWFYRIRSGANPSLWQIAAVVCGAVLALAVFSALGLAVGTDAFFLRPALQWATVALQTPNPWRRSGFSWLRDAEWLIPHFGVFAIAVYRTVWPGAPSHAPYAALYLGCTLSMVVADALATALLQHRYYASWLMPAAALAVAEAMGRTCYRSDNQWWPVAAIGVMLVTISPPLARLDWPRWVVWALGLSLLAAFTVSRYRWRILAIPLVVTATSNVASAPPPTEGKRLFEAVVRSVAHLNQLEAPRSIRFWYSRNDGRERFLFYRGLASAYLWGYRLVSEDFPSRYNPLVGGDAPIVPGMQIAVLTTHEDAVDAVRSVLAPLFLDVVVRQQTSLGVAPYAGNLLLVEVIARAKGDPLY